MCYVAITIFTMNKSDWKQNVLIQRRKIKITFYENGFVDLYDERKMNNRISSQKLYILRIIVHHE